MTDLRKPTDQEQAVIAVVYTVRAKLEAKRIEVVGVGMGRDLIEDESGRWKTLFGLPVVDVGLPDPRALVLLVAVEL